MDNVHQNNLTNCKIYSFGLSDKNTEALISIGDCSATLHWVSNKTPAKKEVIKLKRLDSIVHKFNCKRIDFIKLDIDGHEPAFLDGAINTINKFNPTILLEVSHINYLDYGVTAWDFYESLIKKGFKIYSVKSLKQFKTKRDFLIECGNFAYSSNIIIKKSQIMMS